MKSGRLFGVSKLWVAFGMLVAVTVVALVNSQSASAVSGNGYFTGAYIDLGGAVSITRHDVLSGSLEPRQPGYYAVPSYIFSGSPADDRQNTFDWLRGLAPPVGVTAVTRDQIGATFIVKTMLGIPAGTSKVLTSADWDNLHRRLVQNPNIRVNSVVADPTDYGNGQISFYGGGDGANNHGDNFFATYKNKPGSPLVVIEDVSTGAVYVLERYCANPVGGMSLPEYTPPMWTVDGQSRVSLTGPSVPISYTKGLNNIKPGDRLAWRHTLRNDSAHDMDRAVTHSINRNYDPGNINPIGTGMGAAGVTFHSWVSGVYNVTQDDVGGQVCQRIAWDPMRWNDNGTGFSDWACADVPYNYNLTPVINNLPFDTIDDGTTEIAGIRGSVDNSGPTKSTPANHALIRFVVKGDDKTAIPGRTGVSLGGGGWACDAVGSIAASTGLTIDPASCAVYGQNTGVEIYPGDNNIYNGPDNISTSNAARGDRICYMVLVSAYSPGVPSDQYSHSAAKCIRITKRPKVQVWGGDIRSGDEVRTSMTVIRDSSGTDATYGSWGEYGLLSEGPARSASGGGLSSDINGRPSVLSSAPGPYNKLTFANTPNFGMFGGVPATILPPSVISKAGAVNLTAGSTVSVADLITANPVSRWSVSGGIVIDGGEVPAGKTVIINASGLVRVVGDIRYQAGPYGSKNDLPQLVIVANNIVIKENVSEVSSWLIAKDGAGGGSVSTCNSASLPNWLSGLENDICDNQLVVNGPIVADRLYLRRTFGSEKGSLEVPAEVLNMRPDTYLWAHSFASRYDTIKTSYLRELPPRF